jgi:hypothetical protein
MNLNHPRFTPLIHLAQRAYSNLCRSRRIQLATISTLATIGGLIYALSVMQLQQQRSLLGEYIMVRLAATDIAIGEPITLTNTQEFTMPTQFVLPSTLTSLPDVLTATSLITQGDVISTQNSSAPDEASIIPIGMRAVSIVPRVAMPPLTPGTIVDIIANGKIIAAQGVVLSTLPDDVGVVVAVSEQDAPLVASAAAIGEAAIVLSS